MDKKTQNLDPHLKAAYDRVMNTQVPPSAPARKIHQEEASPQEDLEETKVVAGGKGGGRISPVLLFIAVVLFFVIYTFVWFVVFGLPIPFLPS